MSARVEHIGDATLYLGDARDVLPALADRSIDFIFTDPPYGHNNNNGDLIHRREAALGRLPCGSDTPLGRPIANDGAEANDLVRWFYGEANRLLSKGGCCCCCCGGGGPDPQFARWSLWLDEAIGFKQMVIRPGKIRKIIPGKSEHPTAKDPNLALHFIRLHSQEGESVLDPFMGAGSTLVAALNSRRRFVGVEIDPHWFDVACAEARNIAGRNDFLKPPDAKAQQLSLLTPEESEADSIASYNHAITAIGERVKAGEPAPTTGYFGPSQLFREGR